MIEMPQPTIVAILADCVMIWTNTVQPEFINTTTKMAPKILSLCPMVISALCFIASFTLSSGLSSRIKRVIIYFMLAMSPGTINSNDHRKMNIAGLQNPHRKCIHWFCFTYRKIDCGLISWFLRRSNALSCIQSRNTGCINILRRRNINEITTMAVLFPWANENMINRQISMLK